MQYVDVNCVLRVLSDFVRSTQGIYIRWVLSIYYLCLEAGCKLRINEEISPEVGVLEKMSLKFCL